MSCGKSVRASESVSRWLTVITGAQDDVLIPLRNDIDPNVCPEQQPTSAAFLRFPGSRLASTLLSPSSLMETDDDC